MPDDARHRCHLCRRSIMPTEPRWGGDPQGRLWHYACAELAQFTGPESAPGARAAPGEGGVPAWR